MSCNNSCWANVKNRINFSFNNDERTVRGHLSSVAIHFKDNIRWLNSYIALWFRAGKTPKINFGIQNFFILKWKIDTKSSLKQLLFCRKSYFLPSKRPIEAKKAPKSEPFWIKKSILKKLEKTYQIVYLRLHFILEFIHHFKVKLKSKFFFL